MSKKTCTKKSTRKDRNLAENNTRRNKALKSYFTFKRSEFKDATALESLATAIYPETVATWLRRVNPENF